MTSKRTFYRNVIKVEILSEEPLSGDEDIAEIHSMIEDGPCSGRVITVTENEEIDGPEAAQLLLDQGSDPEFFQLDEEGNDLDEEEAEEMCCVCGKPAEGENICDCSCPCCGCSDFDDVTLTDHGMCYNCFQKKRLGLLTEEENNEE